MTTHLIFPSDGSDAPAPSGDELALYNKAGQLYARSGLGIQPLLGYTRGYVQVAHQLPAGTVAGAPGSTSAWFARVLNTVWYNDIGATLANNTLTVPAGVYDVLAWATKIDGGTAKIAIWDQSLGYLIYGLNNMAGNDIPLQAHGRINLPAGGALQLQMRVSAGGNLGNAYNVGAPEIYALLSLWKVN